MAEIDHKSIKSDTVFGQTQSNIKHKKEIVSQPFIIYRELKAFPIITSPWISSIIFIIYTAVLFHTLDCYYSSLLKLYPQMDQSLIIVVTNLITPNLAPIGYSINTLLTLLIFIASVYNQTDYEGFRYLLAWFGSRLFPVLRYMIELNVIIAAFFMVKDNYSIIFFAIASLINIFLTFFMQNYNLRKDYLCCNSMPFLLFHKLCIILTYCINLITHKLTLNFQIFVVILICQFLIGTLLIFSYFYFGYLIYRHTTPRVLMVLLLAFGSALNLSIFHDQVNRRAGVYQDHRDLVYTPTYWIFISLVAYATLRRIRNNGTNPKADFHKRLYFIFNKLEGSAQDIEDDCQIRGIIRYHYKEGCQNDQCFVNHPKKIYDSKKNRQCFLQKINQGKTSLIKFLIKCIYQTQLIRSDWSDSSLLLEYISFYYMKLKNIFRVTHLLVDLQSRYLNPFQKLKLQRLRRVMMEQNYKINGELYSGNLDIQYIIDSQIKFNQIRQQVLEVLKRNLKFWQYVGQNTIDLSQMTKIMKPNFGLIQQINNNWKTLVKYFQIQKRWKFYFVCFTLYVKNQKVKPTFLQCFGAKVHEDQIFTPQIYHLQKTNQHSKLYNSKILFEPNTCCIHINGHLQKPVIRRVSGYFEKMFKYTESQILQSSLQNLMTPSIRYGHQKKFIQWAGTGKPNNQNTYQIKKIYPLDKQGYLIPVFKFYKQFYSIDQQLQYIGIFKKNKQDQYVALLNDNFQIEALTNSMAEKLKLDQDMYKLFCKLNILIFFPSLIKLTKFQSQLKKSDQQFLFDDNKKIQTVVSHNSNNDLGKKSSTASRKDFSKSNLKLIIPDELAQIQQIYTFNKSQKQNNQEGFIYAIKQSLMALRNAKYYKKYKVQIQIKQRQINRLVYYQLYLRDIEQQNVTSSKHSKTIQKASQMLTQQVMNSVGVQDFHKFFEGSQNSQSISLAFTSNIFIKEDNNKPVNMIQHVKSISISVRFFFVLFVALIIANFFIENMNCSNYTNSGNKLSTMTQFQGKIFRLQRIYFARLARIRSSSSFISRSNQVIELNGNYYFKKIILSQSTNSNAKYQCYNKSLLFNLTKPPIYDQVDVIGKIIQTIITIKSKNNITYKNIDFLFFQGYMIPSFLTLVIKSKQNIHNQFGSIYNITKLKNSILYSIQGLLLILGFVLTLTRILRISISFVSLMEIFTQFSQNDLSKVNRYCNFIQSLFTYLGLKNDILMRPNQKLEGTMLTNTSQQGQQIQDNDEAAINLNKKVKKVQIGTQLTNLKLKSIAYVIIFLLIYGITGFGLNIFLEYSSQQIINFQNQGYQIFQHFSTLDTQFTAILDKYINNNTIDLSRYQQSSDSFQKMKLINSQISVQGSSKFYQIYNNVMFDNFCKIYPQVIGNQTQIQQCISIAQNTLQHGVQSFIFYLSTEVRDYLKINDSKISAAVLQNLGVGLKYCNSYFVHLLNIWETDFLALVAAYQKNLMIVCICVVVLQIITYLILIQILVVGNLESKFEFFKKIYEVYMPDFIVSKQKIIKAKLIVQGIIKK